jgi:hypothetical protein
VPIWCWPPGLAHLLSERRPYGPALALQRDLVSRGPGPHLPLITKGPGLCCRGSWLMTYDMLIAVAFEFLPLGLREMPAPPRKYRLGAQQRLLTQHRSFAHSAVRATFVASAPAAAQGWEEYSYPSDVFSVAFPADLLDTTTYQVVDNRWVSARIHSVRQANVVFATCTPQSEMTDNTARKK